jgi:hypothetical protein
MNGKGLDPRTLIHLKLVTITHERSSYQVYHSFYEEMQSEFSTLIYFYQGQKPVSLTSMVHSLDTQHDLVLGLWWSQPGRPLAMGS